MAWTLPPAGPPVSAPDTQGAPRLPDALGAAGARAWTRAVDALLAPDAAERVAALPAEALDADAVATIAELAGLAVAAWRSARALGLGALAGALQVAAERQRFAVRERQHAAARAARRVTRAIGEAPVALGALAGAALLGDGGAGAARVPPRIELMVPRGGLEAAVAAVEGLAHVEVREEALRGATPRSARRAAECLLRRASEPTAAGYRLPSVEDLVLLHACELELASPVAAFGLLLDLSRAFEARELHWETVHQRASLFGVRGPLWRAAVEAQERLGAAVAPETLARLRPSPWSRLLDRMLGR